MISVHKLLQVIVPKFCWLLLRLHESLYSMYGVPVSICEPMMWSHNFLAGMTRRPRPSLSYLRSHQTYRDQCLLQSLRRYITFTVHIHTGWQLHSLCQTARLFQVAEAMSVHPWHGIVMTLCCSLSQVTPNNCVDILLISQMKLLFLIRLNHYISITSKRLVSITSHMTTYHQQEHPTWSYFPSSLSSYQTLPGFPHGCTPLREW